MLDKWRGHFFLSLSFSAGMRILAGVQRVSSESLVLKSLVHDRRGSKPLLKAHFLGGVSSVNLSRCRSGGIFTYLLQYLEIVCILWYYYYLCIE